MLVKANNDAQSSLSTDQLQQLQQVTQQYSPLQLAWASGYLAAKSENVPLAAVQSNVATQATLTILYGSQTGNAKTVAEQLHADALNMGFQTNVMSMADYKPKSLKTETHLLIVASTNGEGEPPDDALLLHDFLSSKRAPKLDSLVYSVLALGDSSYQFFCQTGKDFDEKLAALGAKRISDRIDCDVDYQDQAKVWQEQILNDLEPDLKAKTADVVNLPLDSLQSFPTSAYSKEQPFVASVVANQKITGRDSNKVVQHLEIDLVGSDLRYLPGDALGILPINDPALVDQILANLNLASEEQVTINDDIVSLKSALVEQLEITNISNSVINNWLALNYNKTLADVVADQDALRKYINSHQFVDFIQQYPATVTSQQLVHSLNRLSPRLYSIASSQEEVEDEVHLTVGLVDYHVADSRERRIGCASGYLIERLKVDDEIKVFIEQNNNFRLPQNQDTDVIMVGPGTGIAPFRAFLQHRESMAGKGQNWLFFGDQTFTQDFLYQVELQNYLKAGVLNRLDVAFSRDQTEKVYVQDKLRKHGADVFAWLENGAHFYICGDMARMAKDVENTLLEIICEFGNKTAEQAVDYLKQLRINKRYQKDVY